MSLHLPLRRVMRPAASIASSATPYTFLIPSLQRRTIFGWGKKKGERAEAQLPKDMPKYTLSEEYLRRKPPTQNSIVRGGLSSSSILEDDYPDTASTEVARNPKNMAAVLDPNPQSRLRWERKMVIKHVQRRGRLTKAQMLKQQERELLSKSHDFKTSVKKLNPLARQIAGKTVEEAIVQMRFSKKKVARDVLEHLLHARDEAIVKRGMGLGGEEKNLEKPPTIMTKDGKRVKVVNPTTIYVDQAWVGKGMFTKTPESRARGRINLLTHPTTSLSVILKEEATRMRLHQEREQKIKNRKVWVHLPNRPVTAQRQYYSW